MLLLYLLMLFWLFSLLFKLLLYYIKNMSKVFKCSEVVLSSTTSMSDHRASSGVKC